MYVKMHTQQHTCTFIECIDMRKNVKTLFIHLNMRSKTYTKYVEYRGQVQVNFYSKCLHVIRISRIIILTDSVLHILNLDHAGSEKYDHNISDNNMCCHSQYVNYPGMYMGRLLVCGSVC